MSIDKEEEFSDEDIEILLALVADGIESENRRIDAFGNIKGLPDLKGMANEVNEDHEVDFKMLEFMPKEYVNKIIENFCSEYTKKSKDRIEDLIDINTKLHLLKSRI